ncbi:MAG: hypothetical protein QXX12_03300, partial [Nanopusillaceae archaeon]
GGGSSGGSKGKASFPVQTTTNLYHLSFLIMQNEIDFPFRFFLCYRDFLFLKSICLVGEYYSFDAVFFALNNHPDSLSLCIIGLPFPNEVF